MDTEKAYSDFSEKNRFWVIGPNSSNFQIHTWKFGSFGEAESFANTMAKTVDTNYDIVEYVGTIRQVRLEPRPIERVGFKK